MVVVTDQRWGHGGNEKRGGTFSVAACIGGGGRVYSRPSIRRNLHMVTMAARPIWKWHKEGKDKPASCPFAMSTSPTHRSQMGRNQCRPLPKAARHLQKQFYRPMARRGPMERVASVAHRSSDSRVYARERRICPDPKAAHHHCMQRPPRHGTNYVHPTVIWPYRLFYPHRPMAKANQTEIVASRKLPWKTLTHGYTTKRKRNL